MDSYATQFLLCTVHDAFNNANDKIVNIVCNGNAITNNLMGEIVCDVPVNGHVFLGVTVWDVYTNGNIILRLIVWDVHTNESIFLGLTVWNVHTNGVVCLGLTVWDVLTIENDWACIIVFFNTTVCITVFDHSPVTHDPILPSVCDRRAYPRRFLDHVGRTTYRTRSLGDGSKRRRDKGL